MKFMGHSSLDIVMTYYHAGTQDLLAGMASVDFGRMLTEEPKQTSEVSTNQLTSGANAANVTSQR